MAASIRLSFTSVAAAALLAAAAGAHDSTAAGTQPIYKQALMDHCLTERHVAFGYNFGPFPANSLLGTKRDARVTGTVVFENFAVQKGTLVLGDGQLVFTKSPGSARADLANLTKRFQDVDNASQVKGNVVVMWPRSQRPVLTRTVLLVCFRASRVA